jgi:hypothetical protein
MDAFVDVAAQIVSCVPGVCLAIFNTAVNIVPYFLSVISTLFSYVLGCSLFLWNFILGLLHTAYLALLGMYTVAPGMDFLTSMLDTSLGYIAGAGKALLGVALQLGSLCLFGLDNIKPVLFGVYEAAWSSVPYVQGCAASLWNMGSSAIPTTFQFVISSFSLGGSYLYYAVDVIYSCVFTLMGLLSSIVVQSLHMVGTILSYISVDGFVDSVWEFWYILLQYVDRCVDMLVYFCTVVFKISGSFLLLVVGLFCFGVAFYLCCRNTTRFMRVSSSVFSTVSHLVFGFLALVLYIITAPFRAHPVQADREQPRVQHHEPPPVQPTRQGPSPREESPVQESTIRSPGAERNKLVRGSEANTTTSSVITSTSQSVDEERQCIICYENPKCFMIRPCNHVCLCEKCSRNVQGLRGKCPMCRNNIQKIERIFM